ncbi:hypothetical protein DACRYDRAFT_95563 [Dacryopinax primogenitus]|uniref:Aminoglycoside phosphotransferase domain-containing protein n=1 Tax=Dacryopinax primogenitus (strain DJM 731) TaxID=1858805 RepID=M5G305_DACPD|nr:uncharacterized protein DACRYDRAFT_95563 [Dacryopinax primogenitus]EJU00217.1 hypothetical protein DACRYDRAFT_95563 [Dacryopinax primogenitus]
MFSLWPTFSRWLWFPLWRIGTTAAIVLASLLKQVNAILYWDDRPVILEEDDVNIWPPNIRPRNIKRALNRRMHGRDRCVDVQYLSHGASHVVLLAKTSYKEEYVVRVTGSVYEHFQWAHPFWQTYKETSEVASMVALRRLTKIPVPRVYLFDEDRDNAVGGVWTLQDYMEGERLYEFLPELSGEALEQMLQVFHLEFSQIGSLHFTRPLNEIRDVCDDDLEIRVGRLVTLRDLRMENEYMVGSPKDTDMGPWDSSKAWLKSIAQGDMDYQSSFVELDSNDEHIRRIQRIIDEPEESNGLFTSGPLSVNAPWCTDMWNTHNIQAVCKDGTVKLVALLDMEGMQIVPRWVLGRLPLLDELPDESSRVLWKFLLEDPLYKQAHEQGSKARHLLVLAQNASVPHWADKRIEEFRDGDWEDNGTLAG